MAVHDLLVSIVSDEKLAVICITVLLYIAFFPPLAAFRAFLFIFGFQQFDCVVPRCDFFFFFVFSLLGVC